jgi:hypothetical protein
MTIIKLIIICITTLFCITSIAKIKILEPAAKKISLCSNTKRLISGTAPSNTALTISCGTIAVITRSNASGKWQVEFPFRTLGDNLDLTVTGGNEKSAIKVDVLNAEKIIKINHASNKKYTVSTHVAERNTAEQSSSILTDGKTKAYYNQGKTLTNEACWKFKTAGSITITIDLEKKVKVNEVRVHAVFVKGYYTLNAPQEIIVQTSIDGKKWKKFGKLTNPPAELSDGKRGCHFSWQKTTGTDEAHFIKVILKNKKYDKYNQIISLDEIEVLEYQRK